jgi:hypothetical protein
VFTSTPDVPLSVTNMGAAGPVDIDVIYMRTEAA